MTYGDLESRVQDLESRRSGGGDGCGCVVGFYSVGAALAVVLSWQAFHALLWAALAGSLSWVYVIYFVVKHLADLHFV